MTTPQDQFKDALLRVLAWLTADALNDEASRTDILAEPLSLEEVYAMSDAGLVLCRGLVRRLAELTGVDPATVISDIATDVVNNISG